MAPRDRRADDNDARRRGLVGRFNPRAKLDTSGGQVRDLRDPKTLAKHEFQSNRDAESNVKALDKRMRSPRPEGDIFGVVKPQPAQQPASQRFNNNLQDLMKQFKSQQKQQRVPSVQGSIGSVIGNGVTPSGGDQLLAQAAARAGLTGDALLTAIAIGLGESGGNARAYNPNAGTGDNSYGLWQINMLGGMGAARRRAYGLSSNDDLFDPFVNARVMYALSGGGKNWQPWSVYKKGAHQQYMDRAAAAARALGLI